MSPEDAIQIRYDQYDDMLSDELEEAYAVVGEILEYFDGYKLATWAPIAAIILRERKRLPSLNGGAA